MTRVVVDSSIALKWVITEPDSATALSLLAAWKNAGITVAAPDLFAYEVANGLYRRARLGEFSMVQARTLAAQLLTAGGVHFEAVPGPDLSVRAMELAERFHLPATYDPHYLALAELEGCEF